VLGLARHFAEQYASRYRRPEPTFTSDALAQLRAHDWPGNVRELEHWIESAVALAPDGVIRGELFPQTEVSSPGAGMRTASPLQALELPLGLSLEEASRRYVEATLEACDGNKTEAAKRLEVGRNSIGRWLKDQ
jgi:Nif-specific regulatory protein